MTIKFSFILILLFTSFSMQAKELLTGQQSLEFHGYFRGSLGMSESGATQAKFQAPGARAAYRLGNEPDTNMELEFNYNYALDKLDKSHVQGIFMLDGYKAHGESSDFTIGNLAQGYLSFNQFFNGDTTLWFGRRYYDRKSIYISDHVWLNPGQNSQVGVGAENVKPGTGKLNIALFRYEDNFDISGTSYFLNSTGLDARWHDLAVNANTKLTLWAGLTARHELPALGYDNESGFGLGGWLDSQVANVKNTVVLLYQTGSSIPQGDFDGKPIREDLGWVLDDAASLEINNTLTYESLPTYSVQWTILARQEDHGLVGNSKLHWYSTGARSIFYFSQHLNLAIEAGVDYVDDKINSRKGSLSKLTAALQVSAERGFYSRPVLRFFITLADWNDDFKGLVGNTPADAPYADNTQGWTLGTQAEVWW